MSEIKDTNYYVVQGDIVKFEELSDKEIIIYSIIKGFSQTEGQYFTGSQSYLATWARCSRQWVNVKLKSLEDLGLIEKKTILIDGKQSVGYRACDAQIVLKKEDSTVNSLDSSVSTHLTGGVNSLDSMVSTHLTGGCQLSRHNNIDIKNIDNIDDKSKSARPQKKTYGEYKNVKLTDNEFQKLNETYFNANELITFLDEYKEQSGKKYKSDYLAIKRWVVDAIKERKFKNNKNKQTTLPRYMTEQIQNSKADLSEEELRKRIATMQSQMMTKGCK